jgi:hypothetical protein
MTLLRLGLVRDCFTLATLIAGLAGCAADPAATKGDGADENTDDGSDNGSGGNDSPGVDGGGGFEVVFQGEGVECGEQQCRDALVKDTVYGAAGCCVDAKAETCGLDMSALGLLFGLNNPGCEQLGKPGSDAKSCPASEPISVLLPDAPPDGLVLPGCCQASGRCGYAADFGNIGFGCVGPERFGEKAGAACDYAP